MTTAIPTWRDYLNFLRSLTKTLEQLTEVEQRKTQAVTQGNLFVVEECMKKEQVLSLSLRGMDQKRDKMLSQLGLTGVNLQDLQKHSPEDLELETKAVSEELRRQYTVFQAASQVARNALECNLHQIEQIQAEKHGGPTPGTLPHQTDFRV